MRPLSYSSLNAYLQNVAYGGRAYRIMQRHSSAKVFVGTNLIMRGDSKPKKPQSKITGAQLNLFAQVQKNVEKYIIAKQNDIEKVNLNYNRGSVNNRELWQKLRIGQEFYYLDANHCFWRIAYLKGYITEALYQRANDNKDLKQTRNKALSCITSPTKMSYFNNEGKAIYTIVESRNLYQQIYDNIRFTSYNIVAEIYHKLPGTAIGYRIDAVIVLKEGLQQVKDFFEHHGLPYDADLCMKKDKKTYINTVKMEEKTL